MANVDRVFGFKVVGTLSGSPWNGKTTKMYKAAGTTVTNDMFPGDLVTLTGTGDAAGIPGVTVATAGDCASGVAYQPVGVVVSIVPSPDHLERVWIDGADAGYVNVCVDPFVIMEVQSNASMAITEIGQNAMMVQTQAGSRTAGTSGQELNATEATTYTYPFKIIGFAQRPDNTVGSADVKVLVMFNQHTFKPNGTAFTGV